MFVQMFAEWRGEWVASLLLFLASRHTNPAWTEGPMSWLAGTVPSLRMAPVVAPVMNAVMLPAYCCTPRAGAAARPWAHGCRRWPDLKWQHGHLGPCRLPSPKVSKSRRAHRWVLCRMLLVCLDSRVDRFDPEVCVVANVTSSVGCSSASGSLVAASGIHPGPRWHCTSVGHAQRVWQLWKWHSSIVQHPLDHPSRLVVGYGWSRIYAHTPSHPDRQCCRVVAFRRRPRHGQTRRSFPNLARWMPSP